MKDNPKKPKKIDLTEPSASKQEEGGGGLKSLPVSIELVQKRSQYRQDFENRLRKDRIELIKYIQGKRNSKLFVFYSHDSLDAKHADIFYELLQELGSVEKLDLFLLSPGGFAEQAFNMARWCRNYSEKFNVIIPYYAKSAATLLSLGADELLMGISSELGPIDPQIRIPDEYGRMIQVSAVSIKDALGVIEELTGGDQAKALKYMPLIERIDLKVLGQHERAIQSAKQYAAELLKMSSLLKDKNAEVEGEDGKKTRKYEKIAHQLTLGFYSHGYAIGVAKAKELEFNVLSPVDKTLDQELWKVIWRLHKMYDDMIKNARSERLLHGKIVEYKQITTILETEDFSVPIEKTFIKNLSDEKYGQAENQ